MIVDGRLLKVTGKLLRVARLDAESFLFLSAPDAFIRSLHAADPSIDLFTFTQKVSDRQQLYPYPVEWFNQAVLPVSSFDDWWTKQLKSRVRGKIRKIAKGGVETRIAPFDDAFVQGIWEIYNECPLRQGRPFRHFGKLLAQVRAESATYLENSTFIGAYLDGKLIGFIKLVADETGSQAKLMNVISMMKHQENSPTFALVAEAVRVCADRKIPNLVYGDFEYANKKADGITFFKQLMAFRRIDLPRYFVPLTQKGKVGYQLGLHRHLSERLPSGLIETARNVRASWYNRTHKSGGLLTPETEP